MKKKLLSLFLSLALVLSLCPAVFAEGTDPTVGELKQVYGLTEAQGLSDEDALVLLIMGDGFAAEDQEDFYAAAAETAKYIMDTSPFDEFWDTIKIYALGVVSNQSGITGATATTAAGVADDQKDTAFGAQYWISGIQRLTSLSAEGEALGDALRDTYLPETDFCLYLLNSTVYGGSGGEYCMASLNTQAYDMMVHEMGHTIGGLADEYYADGYQYDTYPNLTSESDPDKVPWARFIGKNGIGVYPWGNETTGYYTPAQDCKMLTLGKEHEFCEVCKEALRKAICKYSNVTKIFFQPYADEITAGTDLMQYFIVRKGALEDSAENYSAYLYYSEDGGYTSSYEAPSDPGTHWVCAGVYVWNGSSYDYIYSDWYEYTIEAGNYRISLSVKSKVYDGEPADVKYTVEPLTDECKAAYANGTHFVSVDYYVTPYNDSSTTYYYSDRCDGSGLYDVWSSADGYSDTVLEGVGKPSLAGTYQVSVSVYDSAWNVYASKSANYSISLASTKIVDNNDDRYYGAYSYGNNKTVVIFGEGFTAEEQDEFDDLAVELTNSILAQEPFKELQLYFNFMSINTVSNASGVGADYVPKDTFFGVTYDSETGLILTDYYSNCYKATQLATNMCYSYASTNEGAVCIILVNDEHVTGGAVYAPYADDSVYHYFQTIYVSPSAAGWKQYAAAEILNYLAWDAPGYRARTAEEKAAQRLDVLDSMYCAYQNGFGPVIVSRAYNETFVANGKPVDLEPYFHVYMASEEIFGVKLELTYYDAAGNKLDGAPSAPGSYSVLAETVPDPGYENDEYGWQLYQPDPDDYEWWIGRSRGYTTFTILPAASSGSGSGSSGGSGSSNDLPFADIGTGHVFRDYIEYVYEHGIMNGKTTTYFDAASSITRGQLVSTLYRMSGSPDISGEILGYPFSDVNAESYYCDAIYWARLNGIVDGYEDGSFRPNAPVTRQAMVTILYRYAQSLDLDVSVKNSDNLSKFQDAARVSSLMTDSVNWAVEKGFVSGNAAGELDPTGSATRGAAAKILAIFHQTYIA